MHDKPFRLAIENIITRESKSHDPRIYEQILYVQKIYFNELRAIALRRPKCEEIEQVVVRVIFLIFFYGRFLANEGMAGADA